MHNIRLCRARTATRRKATNVVLYVEKPKIINYNVIGSSDAWDIGREGAR